jgi:two-component sensor histidine kinase
VLRLERYGVGFDLVQNIVRGSLGGELSLHNDGGAVAVIRFATQVEGINA